MSAASYEHTNGALNLAVNNSALESESEKYHDSVRYLC